MLYEFAKGVYTVLVTPFDSDDKVDYRSLELWTETQCKSSVTGIVLLGTTSESPTLSRAEQMGIVATVSKVITSYTSPCGSGKKLIIGVGGNDTKETLKFARQIAEQNLCDAFMVTVPSYNKPTQFGIFEHFKMICSDEYVSKYPVIMYNVPGRTSVNMEPSTIKNICEVCPNVCAIKEASGSIDQLIEIRNIVPDLQVFAGDDKLVLDYMVHKSHGVISVASNVIPEVMCEIVNHCLNNKFDKARELFYKLSDFFKALFCETNPIPVKYMLHCIGTYQNHDMRLPMTKLSESKYDSVTNALATALDQEENIEKS